MNKVKRKRRLKKSLKRREKELQKYYWRRYFVKVGILKGE